MRDANDKRKLVRVMPSEKSVGDLIEKGAPAAAEDFVLSQLILSFEGAAAPAALCGERGAMRARHTINLCKDGSKRSGVASPTAMVRPLFAIERGPSPAATLRSPAAMLSVGWASPS